jgi:hypothetical protein
MKGTRFTAVAGHLYLATHDHWTLRAPKDHGHLLRADVMVAPIRHIDPEDNSVYTMGLVTDAYTLGSEIIIHGRVHDDLPGHQEVIKKLRDRELFFELDVSTNDIRYRYASGEGKLTTFTDWWMTAVTIGASPCWDHLPVRFWK